MALPPLQTYLFMIEKRNTMELSSRDSFEELWLQA